VEVAPFMVNDTCLIEEEIAVAVWHLRANKAPGPSGMQTNNLKGWLAAATKEERPDRTRWDALVTVVGHKWQTGELPNVLPWSMMVLLPKPGGSSQGIVLLEVLWKLLKSIIDGRLKAAISFQDALHGFRPGRGMTTAIIDAKLFQQLALIHQVPVFEIFIDLKKAYAP
jgi:hypothetical protein